MHSAVRPMHAARVALAACGPSLLTLALVALIWQAGPRDFHTHWNDETIYWNQAAAFMRAGFDGGYVTVHEQPAAAAFSRFGPHGPAFPVLYGTIARVTGWQPYSPYIINLVLVAVSAGTWLAIVRHASLWPSALLVLGFWPLLYYLPSHMQEPLHFALAFLMAAVCEARMDPVRRIAAVSGVLAIACVMRPTWTLIIPALMWGRDPGWARRALSVPVMLAAFLVAFVFVTRMAAPYPYTAWVPAAVADPVTGIPVLWRATMGGVQAFFVPHREWIVTLLRLQIVAAAAVAIVLWWRHPAERWRMEVAALAVLPVLAAMFPVGDIESGREFHILAPHLLVALLVVAGGSLRWAATAAAVNLLLCLTLYPTYVRHHQGRWDGAAEIRRFAEAIDGVVVFEEGAPSGWANTMLTHADALQPPLLGLPPGIGISFVLDWEDQAAPPRSRYLLLRPDRDADILRRTRLEKLADTSLGTVYRNVAATASAGTSVD